jgi:hypothetical protein
VQKLQGLSSDYFGPNCWDAALVSGKIIPELRYAQPGEMSFWMNSPLCRQLGPDEKPKAGDIVAIRDGKYESHGFIYLTDKLAFSKEGPDLKYLYLLQSPQTVFSSFKVPAECQKKTGPAPEGCPTFANYYDCKPLDQYLRENAESISPELAQYSDCVTNVEMNISTLVLYGKQPARSPAAPGPETVQLKQTLAASLSALLTYSQEESKEPHSPAETFLWQSLVVRLKSATQELHQIQVQIQ